MEEVHVSSAASSIAMVYSGQDSSLESQHVEMDSVTKSVNIRISGNALCDSTGYSVVLRVWICPCC